MPMADLLKCYIVMSCDDLQLAFVGKFVKEVTYSDPQSVSICGPQGGPSLNVAPPEADRASPREITSRQRNLSGFPVPAPPIQKASKGKQSNRNNVVDGGMEATDRNIHLILIIADAFDRETEYRLNN